MSANTSDLIHLLMLRNNRIQELEEKLKQREELLDKVIGPDWRVKYKRKKENTEG